MLQILALQEVRHSGMLLAGIQAEFGLAPRLEHSGVTVLRPSIQPSLFSKKDAKNAKFKSQEI